MPLQSNLLRIASELPVGDPTRRKILAAMVPVEVDDRMVDKIRKDLTKAQRALVKAFRNQRVPERTKSVYDSAGQPLPKDQIIYHVSESKVEVERGNYAFMSAISSGTVKGLVETVHAYAGYTGFPGRDAEAVEDSPTRSELSRITGLPFGGSNYRPMRVSIWNMSPEDFKWYLGRNGEVTVAKFYYTVKGWGGRGSGFIAVDSDGNYRTGSHG